MLFILIVSILLILGFSFGKYAESIHFKYLLLEEAKLQHIPWRNTGKKESFSSDSSELVHASVVIGQDYFKTFVGNLTNFFGGRMSSYESLLERGRREAILRVRQQAVKCGANEIINLRLETSNINAASAQNQQKPGAFEVLAYGTAIKN